ncbi:hypothetical protein ACFOW4_10135 [Micromonospora sp. GCM10011542]|uniref:hypothetical protein n=1 Tax=Micromonospora sp. GCM10011542 TaxID=3317337 RepID=UPI003610311D
MAVSDVFWEEPAERWEKVLGHFEAKRAQLVAAPTSTWGLPVPEPFAPTSIGRSEASRCRPLADALVDFVTDADTWYRRGRASA